jgi:hypothetical protein
MSIDQKTLDAAQAVKTAWDVLQAANAAESETCMSNIKATRKARQAYEDFKAAQVALMSVIVPQETTGA